MKMLVAMSLLSLLAAGRTQAALSGYWETSGVLHAILGSGELADALKQQPIASIVATESGYRVESVDCKVEVRVDRQPGNRPGPGSFTFDIGTADCK